ncbi:hypothetical protein NLX83_13140 [Allokutzneria sp. A3M-2-11 16]|uniref:hypothetical protein n=1 Tax=Allokutzneria sp. A3M-2-11 16 TaxID=2962043 RepID=UPI0020B63E1B|nr:hypothetical protein [Allokutzneria sp. A3M-2-11 16]MCP3800204.1 hypothetical protein [Allokutzneria sp. A3M-2-11 16]
MSNPSLPPSLGANFRELDERISALERGDRSLSYRQALSTNDSEETRTFYMDRDGGTSRPTTHVGYAASLVNPRYPVLVARFVVTLFNGAGAMVHLRSDMAGASRETRRWNLTGGPGDYRHHVFEIAWLHGMPVDQWSDTSAQQVIRRGQILFNTTVTAEKIINARDDDFSADAQRKGFTGQQTEFMVAWLRTTDNRYPVYFKEPEYVFLAPRNAFPTASIEGTLIPGSDVGGYPATEAPSARSSDTAHPPVWTDSPGEWPTPTRDFGYQ